MRIAFSTTSLPFAALCLGALLLPLSLPACGGDNASGGGDPIGAGGSGQGGSGQGGSTANTCNTTNLTGTAGPCGCFVAENHEICPAKGPSPDCSKGAGRAIENCGVLIDAAKGTDGKPAELTRTTTTMEYAGTGAPDVSCFVQSNWKKPGASKTVTITGYARNFANGCDSAGGEIEVHKVNRTGGADDGTIGELIGAKVTVAGGPCAEPNCKPVIVKKKCEEGNERRWRRFEYAGVPTDTELVIVTKGQGYATLHEYNVYISEGDPDLSGDKFEHDVRVALDSDYQLIPSTATGSMIDDDKGAIAGEVHDCGNIRLTHATVDISSPRSYRGYFTDNEDSPLPDPNRKTEGTSSLGLYTALNVVPGPVRISATGIIDGKPVSLGYFDARVEAGVVTSVSLRGFNALQAAQAAGK